MSFVVLVVCAWNDTGISIPESFQQCKLFWPESWEAFEVKNTCIFSRALLVYCKMLYRSMFYYHKGTIFADVYEDDDFSPGTTPALDISQLDESTIMMECQSVIDVLNGHNDENGEKNEFDFIVSALKFRKGCYDFYKSYFQLVKQSINYQQEFTEEIIHTENSDEPDFILLGDSCRTAVDNLQVIIPSLKQIIESLKIGEFCRFQGSFVLYVYLPLFSSVLFVPHI